MNIFVFYTHISIITRQNRTVCGISCVRNAFENNLTKATFR